MSTGKTSAFYAVLIAVAGMAVGMVIASRLDLAPASRRRSVAVPAINSAPLSGPIDATTFRNIAKLNRRPSSTSRPKSRQRDRDLTDYFGGRAATTCSTASSAGHEPQRRPPPAATATPRPRQQGPLMEGRGHRLHHRQDGPHPDEQPRHRRGRNDPVSLRRHGRATRLRGEGRRPRRADRYRAAPADRDAAAAAAPRSSSATPTRCSRATGSWPSATRSASATASASA